MIILYQQFFFLSLSQLFICKPRTRLTKEKQFATAVQHGKSSTLVKGDREHRDTPLRRQAMSAGAGYLSSMDVGTNELAPSPLGLFGGAYSPLPSFDDAYSAASCEEDNLPCCTAGDAEKWTP